MRVEVGQVPLEGLQLSERLPLDWAVSHLEGDAATVDGVAVDVSLRPVGNEVLLQGRLRATLCYECHSCLEPATQPVDLRFTLMCGPPPAEVATDEEEVELLEEDLNYLPVSGPELELDEVIREQLLLAIPMVRRCSPDCQGLCPTCGCNRNVERCSCAEGRIDPRWAALQALRDK